jgi:hypothetical protein
MGKHRRTRLFVLTLGFSRKSCGCSVFNPAHGSGASCTRPPSAAWGGTAKVIILDNLREGVLTPDI